MVVRRLSDLAVAINALDGGYRATVSSCWQSTGRKVSGTRLSRAGRGRAGSKLIVTAPTGRVVLSVDTLGAGGLYAAIDAAARLFGGKLDLSGDDLLERGTTVRVMGFTPLYGTVIKPLARGKRYQVQLRNGVVQTFDAWRVVKHARP